MLEGFAASACTVYPTTSTFYLWVAVPAGQTDEGYAARLLDAGIVVSPGSMFGAANAGFFRVALVPTPAQCEQALERWAAL